MDLSLKSVDENQLCGNSSETLSAVLPLSLFTALYMLVLTFESVTEILWCDHSNETSPEVLWKILFVFPCFTT